MPKKPFTPEEVAAQRMRIMDSASQVMADVGFHHLSMRKLANQLGMTASNIYNYFPDKASLFLSSRRRGFELLLSVIHAPLQQANNPINRLYAFADQLIAFSQRYPGYYQLMFQPPQLNPDQIDGEHSSIEHQVERLSAEWQSYILVLLADALPSLHKSDDEMRKQSALFFVAAIHGLIDSYYYRAMSDLLDGTEFIPQDVVHNHIRTLVSSITYQVESVA